MLTNLVEPWQVGDQRLPLLHEMVLRGQFRETLLEERENNASTYLYAQRVFKPLKSI